MTPAAVKGCPVIFNSTNGTRLLRRFRDFEHVAVGSLVCLSATVRYVNHFDLEPVLCCAGQLNRFSAEDALAAGMILSALGRPDEAFDDASLMAKRLVGLSGESWKAWARESSHGRTLISLGFADDPDYCLEVDKFDFVPVKKNDLFIRYL
jgi:2-phosphosulfolactate phosphatase